MRKIIFILIKKIYDEKINKIFRKLTTDAKDLFKENYHSEKIMHMIIDKYIVDGVVIYYFRRYKGKNFCFELHFKSVSNSFANEVEKILGMQIEIVTILMEIM